MNQLASINSLIEDLKQQEKHIIYALNNSAVALNVFYFRGKLDYLKKVMDMLLDIKQKYIQTDYINLKDIDILINSINFSIIEVRKTIDDYSNFREVSFENLKRCLYKNIIDSDKFISKFNITPKINNQEQNTKNNIDNQAIINKEVNYITNYGYNQKLSDFKLSHEIDFINQQIMVLENSAKMKDLVSLEQLELKKELLKKRKEEINNKTDRIIAVKEDEFEDEIVQTKGGSKIKIKKVA